MNNKNILVIVLSLLNVIAAAVIWIMFIRGSLGPFKFIALIFILLIWQLVIVIIDSTKK